MTFLLRCRTFVLLCLLVVALAACHEPTLNENSGDASESAQSPVEITPAAEFTPYPTAAPAVEASMIHQLKLGPANAFLIEAPDGLILVDTSLGIYADRILSEIEALDKGTLCLIYITHAHIDHYAGANAVRAATGAPVAVHELDAPAMEAGESHLGTMRNWQWTEPWLSMVARIIRVDPTPVDIVLHDGDPVTACGLDGEVVWTPGHTPGSSSLLVRLKSANAGDSAVPSHIFVGDLIANSGDPRIQRTYAQDWGELLPSVVKTTTLRPDYYYVGHGPAPITLAQVEVMELRGPATR